jgi:hypothetical protein
VATPVVLASPVSASAFGVWRLDAHGGRHPGALRSPAFQWSVNSACAPLAPLVAGRPRPLRCALAGPATHGLHPPRSGRCEELPAVLDSLGLGKQSKVARFPQSKLSSGWLYRAESLARTSACSRSEGFRGDSVSAGGRPRFAWGARCGCASLRAAHRLCLSWRL